MAVAKVGLIHLFLDTSTLLHFRMFDEVDWCSTLGAEAIRLVIPFKVTQELDRHKRFHERRRFRQRAAVLVGKILAFSEQEPPPAVRQGVELELEFRLPQADMAELGLDTESNDDWILASVLLALKDHGDALLMTDDAGMILKAKHFSVPFVRPPEDLRLPDEDDPDRRRIRDLESKVLELQGTRPDLSVVFQDGEKVAKFSLQLPGDQDDALRQELEKTRAAVPLLAEDLSTIKELGLDSVGPVYNKMFGANTEKLAIDLIRKHNQVLEQWYRTYEEYLTRWRLQRIQEALTLPIDLSLSNQGTQPGDDVDIYLYFLAHLKLAKDALSPPPPPLPPPRPKSGDLLVAVLGSMVPASTPLTVGDAFRFNDALKLANPVMPQPPASNLGPFFPAATTARFTVARLKHGFVRSLPRIFARFESREQVRSFSVTYKIFCGNLATQVDDSLSVVVEQ